MNEDGSTAPGTGDGNSAPQNENELATELTEAQEQDLVDRTLGFNGRFDVKDEAGEDTSEADKKAAEDKAAADKAEADKKAAEALSTDDIVKPVVPPVEEDKPAEIPAVDLSDLWIEFEGVTVDDEGNQTAKTFKVGVDDELPEEARFKNDKQLAEYLEARDEMKATKKDRQQEHDEQVAEQESAQSAAAARQATQDAWDSEIEDLTGAGLIEAVKNPPADPTKGYTPEEIEADPGLKTIDAVFKFMVAENEKRAAEGKGRLPSFGTAFNLWTKNQGVAEAEAKKKADEEEAKRKAEEVKNRGSMVGGSSGSGSGSGAGGSGEYIYRAGSARSIHQVDTSDL